MRIDHDNALIDGIINQETKKHIDRELAHFKTIGHPVPRPFEMPIYVGVCRERVQRHLEVCN